MSNIHEASTSGQAPDRSNRTSTSDDLFVDSLQLLSIVRDFPNDAKAAYTEAGLTPEVFDDPTESCAWKAFCHAVNHFGILAPSDLINILKEWSSQNTEVAPSAAQALALIPDLSKVEGVTRENAKDYALGLAQRLLNRSSSGSEDGAGSGFDDGASEGNKPKRSVASMLIELGKQAQLFCTLSREAYATVKIGGHHATWKLHSSDFKSWLSYRLYQVHKRHANSQSLQEAIGALEAFAVFEGEEIPVYMRIAGNRDTIYIDLGDPNWRVIKVAAEGWQIISATDAPVKFTRTKGMLPLPMPTRGGAVDELLHFINVGDHKAGDQQSVPMGFILIVAWVLGALRPGYPYPILGIGGEHGSAKSTTTRLVRRLIDPNAALLRRPPREPRDLAIAANNSHVTAFDNLSSIPDWLSDALCSLATGAAYVIRKNYTDEEEMIFQAMRPVILNGIGEIASAADLLDRSIIVSLAEIPDEQRRTEESFWSEFEEAWPRILGALLDVVATGLADLPSTHLKRLPRMADFARWVAACEPTLGWEPGTFMKAYAGNREETHSVALEASPIGSWICAYVQDVKDITISTTDLLAELEKRAGEKATKNKAWPKSSRALSNQLKRIAPNLRATGIAVEAAPKEVGTRRTRVRLVWQQQGEEVRLGDDEARKEGVKDTQQSESKDPQVKDSNERTFHPEIAGYASASSTNAEEMSHVKDMKAEIPQFSTNGKTGEVGVDTGHNTQDYEGSAPFTSFTDSNAAGGETDDSIFDLPVESESE